MWSSLGEKRQMDIEDKQVTDDWHSEQEESSDEQVFHQAQLKRRGKNQLWQKFLGLS